MTSRTKARLPRFNRGALDLAGWFPPAPEGRTVLDTLNIEAPAVRVRDGRFVPRPWQPNMPRPAIQESNYIRDVYGDSYTLSAQVMRGAFGSFKVASQVRQRVTKLMAAKQVPLPQIDLPRNRTRVSPALREFNAMRGSAVAPYGITYTVTPLDPEHGVTDITPVDAYLFMPLGDTDVMEATNALHDLVKKRRATADFMAPGFLREHATKRCNALSEATTSFARHVLRSAAQDLTRLHAQGLVHADVKLENMLLMRNGEVFLADYGGTSSPRALTHTGTWGYAAPEQIRTSYIYDQRADIYGLAICIIGILYENPLELAGVLPMHRVSHATHRRNLLEKWRLLELKGETPKISPGDTEIWENLNHIMQQAKACMPKLMPLLAQMLALDPAARPTAAQILATLDAENMQLTGPERGQMLRALFRIPQQGARKQVNKLSHSKTPRPHAPTLRRGQAR